MARWLRQESASFEDMRARLRNVGIDSPPELKQQRDDWLEEHHLSFVDFVTWKRARDPLAAQRPPSRRKFMTAEQLRELDEKLEREGPPRW